MGFDTRFRIQKRIEDNETRPICGGILESLAEVRNFRLGSTPALLVILIPLSSVSGLEGTPAFQTVQLFHEIAFAQDHTDFDGDLASF